MLSYPSTDTPRDTEPAFIAGDTHSTAELFRTLAGTIKSPNKQLADEELVNDMP
jgi:hypothetical protein